MRPIYAEVLHAKPVQIWAWNESPEGWRRLFTADRKFTSMIFIPPESVEFGDETGGPSMPAWVSRLIFTGFYETVHLHLGGMLVGCES